MKRDHLVFIFIASLMFNAFLGGLLLSGRIGNDPMPFPKMGKDDMGPPKEDMIFKRLTERAEKLSPDGQKKVVAIVEKYEKAADKNGMNDKRHFFDDIQATMTAPNFDKAKIEKIHKELNSSESKFKESIGQMMIEIASGLSNEDRIQFFQELFPQHPPMDKDRHDDDRFGEPEDGPNSALNKGGNQWHKFPDDK